MTKGYILQSHNHKIWQSKSGKWDTYIDDKSCERGYRRIERCTEKELLDFLYALYFDKKRQPSIKDVFEMWIQERIEYDEISPQSLTRYRNDFKRFFKDTIPLCNKPMSRITESELAAFIKSTIRKEGLTSKSYSGMRTIIRGVFGYAKQNGYTKISITEFFGDLSLPRAIFKKSNKSSTSEVFTEEETELVTEHLRSSCKIKDLGLLLQFETGVRIGELCALKFSDVSGRTIHIQRTEIEYRDEETRKYVREIRESTKTEAGNRYILITDRAVQTIEKIKSVNPDGEYMFMNYGRKIHPQAFHKHLAEVCDELGIPRRSTHKIRKTYGTTLFNNRVDESVIASQMGHTDITTTKKYYYFNNRDEETERRQIASAIKY